MNRTAGGWILFIAAICMMSGLLATDISQWKDWSAVSTPAFIASMLGHISTVGMAFISGRLIPDNRNGKLTRSSDQ